METKLYFVNNGNFIEELKNDNAFQVKLALIEQGLFLSQFCSDDWRVCFKLLQIHGKKYNEYFYFDDEHPEIQRQLLENGEDIEDNLDSDNEVVVQFALDKYGYDWAYENDLFDDEEEFSVNIKKELFKIGHIKKISDILDNKELTLFAIPHLSKEKIEKIFEETNDPDIIKSCIENSVVIQNFTHHDKISTFLTSLTNRIWSIQNNFFLEVILKKEQYDNCKATFKTLIINNYLNFQYNKENGKCVYNLLPKFFDIDTATLIAYHNQEYLMENKLFYNDKIIAAIINKITCLEVIDYIMNKTRDVNLISQLVVRKKTLKLIKDNNKIISIENRITQNKLIKQL